MSDFFFVLSYSEMLGHPRENNAVLAQLRNPPWLGGVERTTTIREDPCQVVVHDCQGAAAAAGC